MTKVYDLQGERGLIERPISYPSILSAEHDLVKNGTDTTRALFIAAQITFELNRPKDSTDAEFLVGLMLMQRGGISLVGETEATEDIIGVGTWLTVNTEVSRSALLRDLAVLPQYQKKGYGSALLAHIETKLSNEGVSVIELASSEAAIPFYEHHGYSLKTGNKIRGMMTKDLPTV